MNTGVLLCLILLPGHISAYSNLEEKLLDNLLRNYSSSRRPVRNSSLPVEVIVGFEISKFLELDEAKETLEVAGLLNLVWVDEFLTWNPESYGGIKYLSIGYRLIWRPDIVIINSADNFFVEDWYHFTGMRVRYSGEVYWFPGGKFALSCPLDVTGFPYDDQMCQIKIATWITDLNQVLLTNNLGQIKLWPSSTNGQWEVINTSSENRVQKSASPSISGRDDRYYFSAVVMKIYIRRRYQRTLLYIQIPSMVTSGLAGVAFIIPPQFAEKVSVAFSALVSFTVFLMAVVQNLPKSSDDLPIFSMYMIFQMLSVALVMIFEAIVVNVYHRQERSKMSGRLWIIQHLGPLVGVKHQTTVKETDEDKDQEENSDCSSGQKRDEDNLENINIAQEWQITALILDRLLFIIWALMNIAAFTIIYLI